ncbi:LuxR C-terminal-related transcriptional regulator [Actinosynnema sp. NPDC020468]|uniref:helix-turn-helix transcriptional regulator n=1 Tax=Actinosynnema sp. NPDC020468 TaxID=3154488 RepID=UPI0033DB3FCF
MEFPARPRVGTHADAFRSLFERSGTCMAIVDTVLDVQEANRQFVRELNGPRDVVGRNLLDLVRHDGGSRLRHRFAQLADGRRERLVEQVGREVPDGGGASGTLTAVAVQGPVAVASAIVVSVDWDTRGGDDGSRERRPLLTELDARILENVAVGMSTVKIASILYLSRQGVEYHVATMLRKLKAGNRAALVSRAYAIGVLNADAWPPRVDEAFLK